MIEKWYALRCDACGGLLNYWQKGKWTEKFLKNEALYE